MPGQLSLVSHSRESEDCSVIPAKAGIQEVDEEAWIPAPVFTGVTFFRGNDAWVNFESSLIPLA